MKNLGHRFESLKHEARSNSDVAAYLDMVLTKEQVMGYLIAAIRAENLEPDIQNALIQQMEQQMLTLRPEEAEYIYAGSWFRL